MITLGCDPELALMDRETGQAIDPRSMVKVGNMHLDGRGVELNPQYSSRAQEVAANFGQMIKVIAQENPAYALCAASFAHIREGNYKQGYGGHIHIGGIKEKDVLAFLHSGNDLSRKSILLSEAGHTDSRKAILLGASYLWRLEDHQAGWSRRGIGWGKVYSAHIESKWGHNARDQHDTLEIRSPSSDWTADPALFTITLTFAKSLAVHCRHLDHQAIPTFEEALLDIFDTFGGDYSRARVPSSVKTQKFYAALRDWLSEVIPERLLRGLDEWSIELATRRNENKLIPLNPDVW